MAAGLLYLILNGGFLIVSLSFTQNNSPRYFSFGSTEFLSKKPPANFLLS